MCIFSCQHFIYKCIVLVFHGWDPMFVTLMWEKPLYDCVFDNVRWPNTQLRPDSLWWRKGYVRRPKTRWIFDRQTDNESTFEETFFFYACESKKFTPMHGRPSAASIPTPVEPSCPPTCACTSSLFGRSASVNWFQQLCSVGSPGSSGASHEPQVYSSKPTIWQVWQLPAATRRSPPARLRSFADGASFIFTSSSLISSPAYFLLHFGLSLPAVITITIPDTQLNVYLHHLSSPQPRKSGISDCSGSEECWGSLLCLSLFRLFSQHPLRNTVNKSLCFHHRTVLLCQCMHSGKVVMHFLENKWWIFF